MAELTAVDARNMADALAMLDEMTAKTGVTIDGGAWVTIQGRDAAGPLYRMKDRETGEEHYQLGLGRH